MVRALIFIFLILLIGFFGFYFYGSQSNLDTSDLEKLVEYDAADPVSDTLQVMTYNIGYLSGMTNNRPEARPSSLFNQNLNQVTNSMRSIAPDIVGFQEIDFQSSRSHYVNQLDIIAESLDFHMAYQSVNWDKRYVPFPYWPLSLNFGKVISGQAILTDLPILETNTVTLEMPTELSFLYKSFYLDRLLQVVLMKTNSDTLAVLNVHLEAWDEPTRVRQVMAISEYYEKYAAQYPTLLIGDFNSAPVSEGTGNLALKELMKVKDIASGVSDSTYRSNPELYYTFSSAAPYQRIDYILYNPSRIQPIETRVVREVGESSDHLPVLMRFTFK